MFDKKGGGASEEFQNQMYQYVDLSNMLYKKQKENTELRLDKKVLEKKLQKLEERIRVFEQSEDVEQTQIELKNKD